jgi:GDP-4-dehydro-6-deoxy-D-mannose reductase
LVFGATGFVGTHVTARRRVELRSRPIEILTAPGDLDIRDEKGVLRLLSDARPAYVLHLAAQTFVPESFGDPRRTFDVNLIGTFNVLQALRATAFAGRMIYVSTGEVYGRVAEEALPISESLLTWPFNPYAVSKLAAEALCYQWSQTEGLDIIIARPFNHIGPGQSDKFVVSGFAHQIAQIRKGRMAPVLSVGDIDVTRDFLDVEDVVSAYFALFDSAPAAEVYNVSSGVERRIRDVLDDLLRIAGVEARIEGDAARLRPNEQRRVVASAQKLRDQTGWAPVVPFETSIERVLAYWEART